MKEYFVITVENEMANEVFYPSGYVDFAINISGGSVVTSINGRPIDMPKVEVLGHLTSPTRLTVSKNTSILIARIYPHASSLFFTNPISHFTNNSIDLCDVIGSKANDLHDHLMHANSLVQQVQALDNFFLQTLRKNEKKQKKVTLVEQICISIYNNSDAYDLKYLSNRYGLSERYIQKLFVDAVGLSPRSFFSVQRFNKSLALIQSSDLDFTSIAYECGYYDQAHFIHEFKKFTGTTPSEARPVAPAGTTAVNQTILSMDYGNG